MLIPHRELSREALQGLIEEFVTREGTDYGVCETPLQVKVDQVRHQLESGHATIVFDQQTGSCTIVLAEQVPQRLQGVHDSGTDLD